MSDSKLTWHENLGLGYFPVNDFPYDEKYLKKYDGYAATDMGRNITQARVDMVRRHYAGPVVDVGIGCGQFVEQIGDATGYDVNPAGVQWLKDRGLWCDIYNGHICRALTFWDSLEHIKDIDRAVLQAREFVFVSLPIFRDREHTLNSRHYREDEHYWYFTRTGFIACVDCLGFDMIECNQMEQYLGREDIESFAFRRRDVVRG